MPHIEYEPDPITDTTQDEQLSDRTTHAADHNPRAQQEAEDFLRDALADGPQPTKQVETEAREGYGITATTMKRARKTLGIESFRPTIPSQWYPAPLPNAVSNTANAPIHKQPDPLDPLAKSPGKSSDTTPQESKAATLFVHEPVGTNGHDADAINQLLNEVSESDSESH